MTSFMVWDITPFSPMKVNRLFGGTCRLCLQGRNMTHARNQHEASSKRLHVAPKRRLTFNRLNGVVRQKIGLLCVRVLSAFCIQILVLFVSLNFVSCSVETSLRKHEQTRKLHEEYDLYAS
jgi:hypothetical protein